MFLSSPFDLLAHVGAQVGSFFYRVACEGYTVQPLPLSCEIRWLTCIIGHNATLRSK